ncbi:MAG: hypothetical protein B6226_05970 [Candidatus Cloacimonetes bacterium 4572_65]|nr:MAG: hypothetical protein B6226_05970 [Candidatus Cloacimonetes bacterium 4572_65]
MIQEILIKALFSAITIFLMLIYGLTLGGIMRRVVARVHGRFGAPFYQPLIDILKNNNKRTAISHGMMFYLGPIFRFAGGIGTFLFIPVVLNSPFFANFSSSGDILLIMYFIFFGQLGMALGAGEGGHPYSGIAIARGLAQMSAFELPFALAVISLVVQHGTLDLVAIVQAQQGSVLNWTLFTNPVAVITAYIAMLGMNMQSPFDIVIAPQEIPIGPPTEFPSQFLGMLQTNRGLFTAAKLVLFVNLWFGGATNLFEMMVKVFFLYFSTVIIGVSFPRYRTDQAIRFFLKVPTVLGIISILLMAMMN